MRECIAAYSYIAYSHLLFMRIHRYSAHVINLIYFVRAQAFNIWLSKALFPGKMKSSILIISLTHCTYIINIKIIRWFPKMSGCVFVWFTFFCHPITRKRLHWSLWNFAWSIFVYIFWRTLLILVMIFRLFIIVSTFKSLVNNQVSKKRYFICLPLMLKISIFELGLLSGIFFSETYLY